MSEPRHKVGDRVRVLGRIGVIAEVRIRQARPYEPEYESYRVQFAEGSPGIWVAGEMVFQVHGQELQK